MNFLYLVLFLHLYSSFDVCAQDSLKNKINISIKTLQNFWWDEDKGSWNGGSIDPDRGLDSGMIDWWNAGNTVEVLANSIKILPEAFKEINHTLYRMFEKQNISGIIDSKSYDDSGWIALSWLRVYEETGNVNFLERSKLLYQEILTAWDDVCGGGLYWAGDEEGGGFRYKNAVTNELFIMLSLRLKDNTNDESEKLFYKNWAFKAWKWFRNSGMLVPHGNGYWIVDGLNNNCTPAGDYWSYNQGIILGGIGKLYEETSDIDFINLGEKLILSMIDRNIKDNPWLYEDGVLREKCEPNCSSSAKQFKGIYLRYVDYFHSSSKKSEKILNSKIFEFIENNAKFLWEYDRDEENRFGLVWRGPVNETDAILQTSGIDLLISLNSFIEKYE